MIIRRLHHPHGFTLVEMMVCTAILGLLAAVVYPAYAKSAHQAQRQAAAACSMQIALRAEQQLLDARSVLPLSLAQQLAHQQSPLPGVQLGTNSELTAPVVKVFPSMACLKQASDYDFSITEYRAHGNTISYRIDARPTNAPNKEQAACGTLSLDSFGKKSASGSNSAKCWG